MALLFQKTEKANTLSLFQGALFIPHHSFMRNDAIVAKAQWLIVDIVYFITLTAMMMGTNTASLEQTRNLLSVGHFSGPREANALLG